MEGEIFLILIILWIYLLNLLSFLLVSEELQDVDGTKESMLPKSESGSHSFTEEDDDLKAANGVQLEEVDFNNRNNLKLYFLN